MFLEIENVLPKHSMVIFGFLTSREFNNSIDVIDTIMSGIYVLFISDTVFMKRGK